MTPMRVSITVAQNKAGKWFSRVKAGNGEKIAHTEAYGSKAAAVKTATRLSAIIPDSILIIDL